MTVAAKMVSSRFLAVFDRACFSPIATIVNGRSFWDEKSVKGFFVFVEEVVYDLKERVSTRWSTEGMKIRRQIFGWVT